MLKIRGIQFQDALELVIANPEKIAVGNVETDEDYDVGMSWRVIRITTDSGVFEIILFSRDLRRLELTQE